MPDMNDMHGGDQAPGGAGAPGLACEVDLDRLMRLLKRVEQAHHRQGWGELARLMVVYDERHEPTRAGYRAVLGENPSHGSVPTLREGGYVAHTLVSPLMLHGLTAEGLLVQLLSGRRERGRPVWEHLRVFAVSLAYADADRVPRSSAGALGRIRAMLRLPGTVAFVFVSEAWAEFIGGGGLREARVVQCVDREDRVHEVQRLRGDRLQVLAHTAGPRPVVAAGGTAPRRDLDAMAVPGDIVTSLRVFADIATRRTPAREEFGQWYPTLRPLLDSGELDELLPPRRRQGQVQEQEASRVTGRGSNEAAVAARTWDLRDLAGAAELGEAYGVNSAGISNWRTRRPDSFPEPVVHLAMGPLFSFHQVRDWFHAEMAGNPHRRSALAKRDRRDPANLPGPNVTAVADGVGVWDVDDLIGRAEMMEELLCSRKDVLALTARVGFPPALLQCRMGAVFSRRRVAQWYQDNEGGDDE